MIAALTRPTDPEEEDYTPAWLTWLAIIGSVAFYFAGLTVDAIFLLVWVGFAFLIGGLLLVWHWWRRRRLLRSEWMKEPRRHERKR